MSDRVLLVMHDVELRQMLGDTLEGIGDYLTARVSTFEEALTELLLGDFALVVVGNDLPDLSGMDFLAVVKGLRARIPVVLIDDTISANTAMAAIRLGAVEYFYKPIKLHHVIMQIESHVEAGRPPVREELPPTVTPDTDFDQQGETLAESAEVLADSPFTSAQTAEIELELQKLSRHIGAEFVGMLDGEGRKLAAVGLLEEYDEQVMRRALSIDHEATGPLAKLLKEKKFHASHFEGDVNGIYILEVAEPFPMSMVIIANTSVKTGMVWLYAKRSAEALAEIFERMGVTGEAA